MATARTYTDESGTENYVESLFDGLRTELTPPYLYYTNQHDQVQPQNLPSCQRCCACHLVHGGAALNVFANTFMLRRWLAYGFMKFLSASSWKTSSSALGLFTSPQPALQRCGHCHAVYSARALSIGSSSKQLLDVAACCLGCAQPHKGCPLLHMTVLGVMTDMGMHLTSSQVRYIQVAECPCADAAVGWRYCCPTACPRSSR